MFVELGGAAAKYAWEHKSDFADSVKKIAFMLKNGWVTLTVFGSGGVGKTTLGHLLSASSDPTKKTFDYIESENTEPVPLKGKVFGTILVAAGQERRRLTTWPELFQKLSAGNINGVINVVAYGYHSVEALASYTEHRVYKEWRREHPDEDLSAQAFVPLYQAAMLQEEINALEYLRPHLLAAKGKLWMLTVVTKQDLWWDDRHGAREHYTQGDYNHVIAEIRSQRGAVNFSHEYISLSLKRENLATATEMLKSTAAGYDDRIQVANLARLSQSFRQLVENANV